MNSKKIYFIDAALLASVADADVLACFCECAFTFFSCIAGATVVADADVAFVATAGATGAVDATGAAGADAAGLEADALATLCVEDVCAEAAGADATFGVALALAIAEAAAGVLALALADDAFAGA